MSVHVLSCTLFKFCIPKKNRAPHLAPIRWSYAPSCTHFLHSHGKGQAMHWKIIRHTQEATRKSSPWHLIRLCPQIFITHVPRSGANSIMQHQFAWKKKNLFLAKKSTRRCTLQPTHPSIMHRQTCFGVYGLNPKKSSGCFIEKDPLWENAPSRNPYASLIDKCRSFSEHVAGWG